MNDDFAALVARQEGVVDRDQLSQIGASRATLRKHFRSGRWVTLGSKVVVLHNGPLLRAQREWAALLAAGDHAVLAGRTGLALSGLRGWEDEAVHLLVPRGRDAPRASGLNVVIHETRVPANRQLASVGSPRRTPVDRSAIDAASWSRNERTACGLVAAVVQQRLSTGPRLLEALGAAGPIRHRRILRFALNDISGGAQALSEIDFAVFCRKYRLGRAIRQAVRRDGTGKRRYLDVLIESPGGARVACEIDGALHLVPSTYWQDMFRANELLIAGQPLLRFPTIALRLDEPVVADQIERALRSLEAAA